MSIQYFNHPGSLKSHMIARKGNLMAKIHVLPVTTLASSGQIMAGGVALSLSVEMGT
jgi:hypothetical protein